MAQPKSVYQDRIQTFEKELQQVKKKLFTSSMLRLGIFVLSAFGVYWFWSLTFIVIAVIAVGLSVFIALVNRHLVLQHHRNRLEALIHINQTELEVLNGKYSHLPQGKEYIDPTHAFSQDVDLFGRKSFFQYLNRTALLEGERRLAFMLTENNIGNIDLKQDAIRDLTDRVAFRQEFSALALLSKDPEENPESVQKGLKDLKDHQFFTPSFSQTLAIIFSILSLLIILAVSVELIPNLSILIWMFIGWGITGIYMKKANGLEDRVTKMQKVFRQYHRLLGLMEKESFVSEILKEKQQIIQTENKKASQIIYEFSKALDAFDQRENLLMKIFGSAFLLWDLRTAARLEKWMKEYVDKVGVWFEVIADMDAYNSLGNFAFNHPHYNYPILPDNQTVFDVKGAVHPLIPEKEAVTNDFKIDKEEFLIITGANMAGKSTFLRTVSLQIIMSNVGLPVRAEHSEYSPIKLITSMRTVDSLAEESSYFYAELSRLKFIIDALKTDRYFIVLDEILKGTNSKDKAIGSKKFLEKLVRSKSTGIIATHDLSLCEVADKMPSVRNHYFDAQIIDDELYFDYKMKDGICQNMNASFLLRKMEIVDD